jgi:hypothetical protein
MSKKGLNGSQSKVKEKHLLFIDEDALIYYSRDEIYA